MNVKRYGSGLCSDTALTQEEKDKIIVGFFNFLLSEGAVRITDNILPDGRHQFWVRIKADVPEAPTELT